MYLPSLEIGVPQASLLTALWGSELHCKVAAMVLELQSYQCMLIDSCGAWDLLTSIWEIADDVPDGAEPARVWEHRDLVIQPTLGKATCAAAFDRTQGLRAYFDGVCREGEGYSGVAVFGTGGEMLQAHAEFHGHEVELLRLLGAHQLPRARHRCHQHR